MSPAHGQVHVPRGKKCPQPRRKNAKHETKVMFITAISRNSIITGHNGAIRIDPVGLVVCTVQWIQGAMRSSGRAFDGHRECPPYFVRRSCPARARCRLRCSCSWRTIFGCAKLLRHAPARGASSKRRVARALSGKMRREGSHASCRRRRRFGLDATRQRVSCVRVCRDRPTRSC